MFLQGSKKPAAMALGFAGEGVEEKGGITMHRLGREEGWRGRKEEGGEVPGQARPVAGGVRVGVGVGVGGGGVVEGMPQLAVGRPAAAVVVLHPVPGLRKTPALKLRQRLGVGGRRRGGDGAGAKLGRVGGGIWRGRERGQRGIGGGKLSNGAPHAGAP